MNISCLVKEVTPQGAVIADHRVGGVIPGPVDLYHVLLRPARLLRQPVMILLDPGVDQAQGPQGSQGQVSGCGGGVGGGAALER